VAWQLLFEEGGEPVAGFLLVTNRLSKTTSQVITVDGGLFEAFLR
jgi:hypothetical protein